jgi:hypothetical protein
MSTIDFVRLVENDLHQQAVKRGKDYFFKCPFHGGGNEKTGSLKVSNGDSKYGPGFHCFGCYEHGGPVGYFLKRGYNIEEARRMAGAEAGPYTPGPQVETIDPPDNPPGVAWQKRAREFLEYSRNQFATFAQARGSETDFEMTDRDTGEKTIKRMAPVEWWIERGLSVPTGETWGIGYNPKDWYIPRERFGLPPNSEHPNVWLPQGFVIPCMVGPDLWYVKIRRPKGEPKYIHIPGSMPALYMAENLSAFPAVIFTEGELDALLTWQEVADFVGVATLGASTNAQRMNIATWGIYLLYPKYKFTVYDLDEAGKKGAEYLARFKFQRLEVPKVKPFDKDITDYHNATGRIREWILGEFAQYPGLVPEFTW